MVTPRLPQERPTPQSSSLQGISPQGPSLQRASPQGSSPQGSSPQGSSPQSQPQLRLPEQNQHEQNQPKHRLSQSALDIPRSGIRDVFDRVDAVPDAISLCVGEPSDTAAPHIVEAACASMRNGQTKYTNILGIEEFRTAVARYSAEVKGLRYDPRAEIQAVDGATMGLFLALKTVVGPGDEVIIPSPFFTSYDAEVMLCGADVVTVPLRAQHHMQLNADDIERAITPRTKAVILNSPGNPSGAVTPAEELRRIAVVCIRHDIWAISDEVYHPYVFGSAANPVVPSAQANPVVPSPQEAALTAAMPAAPSIAGIPGMKERTIVVESLSKTFAMTGWRIGYLLAPDAVIEQTAKIAELMHSSVNATAQYGAVAALTGPRDHIESMRRHYDHNRSIVLNALRETNGLNAIDPQGAFYAFVDIRRTGMDSETFSTRLLHDEHVAVVPGNAFGAVGEGFIRLSYAGDTQELTEAMMRLRRFAATHTPPVFARHTHAFHPVEMMA